MPQFWILSSNKQMLLVQGICQSEDLKSAVVVGLPIILWKSSLLRVEWISGWRSGLASRIQSCVWVLKFTRYMRWCLFRYVRNPRIESSWIKWWRRRWWICKNVSRYTMCVPNAWRPFFAAFPENGLAFHQDLDEVGKTQVDWCGNVHCVLVQHLESLSNHSDI